MNRIANSDFCDLVNFVFASANHKYMPLLIVSIILYLYYV